MSLLFIVIHSFYALNILLITLPSSINSLLMILTIWCALNFILQPRTCSCARAQWSLYTTARLHILARAFRGSKLSCLWDRARAVARVNTGVGKTGRPSSPRSVGAKVNRYKTDHKYLGMALGVCTCIHTRVHAHVCMFMYAHNADFVRTREKRPRLAHRSR